MIIPVKRYGEEVLRKKAGPVTDFGPAFRRLADDMAETMYAAPGIGLAAPQVGVGIRLIVLDVTRNGSVGQLYRLANPEIVETSVETDKQDEGCLSVPGFFEPVVRPIRAVVRGQDVEGLQVVIEAEGILARCFMHEVDHLEGILFVDRLAVLRRKLLKNKLKKQFGGLSTPGFPAGAY